MSEYSGSALVVTWTTPTGTTILSGNQRSFSYTPSINLIDATSGSDANKNYITGVKDGSAAFEALLQAGSGTGGTASYSIECVEGKSGTLQWQPEGTATSKPKYSMPAICMGASYSYPYEDVVTVSVPFQQNGARVDGTN